MIIWPLQPGSKRCAVLRRADRAADRFRKQVSRPGVWIHGTALTFCVKDRTVIVQNAGSETSGSGPRASLWVSASARRPRSGRIRAPPAGRGRGSDGCLGGTRCGRSTTEWPAGSGQGGRCVDLSGALGMPGCAICGGWYCRWVVMQRCGDSVRGVREGWVGREVSKAVAWFSGGSGCCGAGRGSGAGSGSGSGLGA